MKQVTVTVYKDGTVVARTTDGDDLFSGRLSLGAHLQLREAVKRVVSELRNVVEGMKHDFTTALFIEEGKED